MKYIKNLDEVSEKLKQISAKILLMTTLEKYLKKIGTDKMCPVAVILREDKILIGLRNYTPDKWKKISV